MLHISNVFLCCLFSTQQYSLSICTLTLHRSYLNLFVKVHYHSSYFSHILNIVILIAWSSISVARHIVVTRLMWQDSCVVPTLMMTRRASILAADEAQLSGPCLSLHLDGVHIWGTLSVIFSHLSQSLSRLQVWTKWVYILIIKSTYLKLQQNSLLCGYKKYCNDS